MAIHDGFIAPPWWTTMSGLVDDDYTRTRRHPSPYTMDDYIGRPDYYKTSDQATASGTQGAILI